MEQILPGAAGTGHSMAVGEGGGGKDRSLCFLASTQLRVSVITPGLFSFFSGMLEYDPAKRFSIQQIRQHK